MAEKTLEEILTLKEAAKELRLSISTLKRYIYSGVLPTYRTPGGGHRVRRRDLENLLVAPPESADHPGQYRTSALPQKEGEISPEKYYRAFDKRLNRVEVEMEQLECSIEALSVSLRRLHSLTEEVGEVRRDPGCEIKVLGPGCRACDQLASLVLEIAHSLGLGDDSISRVKDLQDIAEYGPTAMPALIINNRLVASGRLPDKSRLTELLKNCVAPN